MGQKYDPAKFDIVEEPAPAPARRKYDPAQFEVVDDATPVTAAPAEPKSTKFGVFDTYTGPTIDKTPEPMSMLETVAHKFPQGAMQNFSDEGVGALTAARTALNPIGGEKDGMTWSVSPLSAGRSARDAERGNIAQADKDHPVVGGIAETAGNLYGTAAMGLTSSMLANPTLLMGLNALGMAGGDIAENPGQVAAETGINFGLGKAVEKGLGAATRYIGDKIPPGFKEAILKRFQAAGEGFRETARERAVKSVASGKNINEMVGATGKDPAAVTRKRVQDVGSYLLDEPQPALDGDPLMKMVQTRRGLSDRMDKVRSTAGRELDDIKLDLGSRAQPEDLISQEDLAAQAESKLLPNYKTGEGLGKTRDYVMNEIQRTMREGDVPKYDLQALETLKTNLMKRSANWYKNGTGDNPEALADIASFVKEVGEDKAGALVSKYAPELEGQFTAAKAAYAKIAGPSKAISAELGRDLRNNAMSLSAKGAGMAGAASDKASEVARAVDAGKWSLVYDTLRNHAPKGAAVIGNELGKKIQGLPQTAANMSSSAASAAIRALQSDPEQYASFVEWLNAKREGHE